MGVVLLATVTETGLQALMDAENHGLKLYLTEIAFGDQGYIPTRSQTSLKHEILRVPIASGKVYKEDHVLDLSSMLPEDTPEFPIREVGVYDENGRLCFIWSHPDVKIGDKSRFMTVLVGLRMQVTDVPFDRIEIVETNPDVKLLYAEEFLNLGIGILHLENTVDFLAQKVESNQDRLDVLESQTIPQVESRLNCRIDGVENNLKETAAGLGAGVITLENTVRFIDERSRDTEKRVRNIEESVVPHLQSEISWIRDEQVPGVKNELQSEINQIREEELPGVREELLGAIITNATALIDIQRILVEQKLNNL